MTDPSPTPPPSPSKGQNLDTLLDAAGERDSIAYLLMDHGRQEIGVYAQVEAVLRELDALKGSTPPTEAARPLERQPAQWIIDLAVEASGYSPCRSKRGVVIFRDGNVVSHGHNYKPVGFACDGSDRCKSTCRVEAVHAEQDALMAVGRGASGADMLHVKTVDGKLVPSGGPSCVQCSKLALAFGIEGVWLFHEDGWRRYPAVEFHGRSLATQSEMEAKAPEPFKCKGRANTDPPQDCNWPFCGCDPYADKVLIAIQESALSAGDAPQPSELEKLVREVWARCLEWRPKDDPKRLIDWVQDVLEPFVKPPVAAVSPLPAPSWNWGYCLCGLPATTTRPVLDEGFSLPVCDRHAALPAHAPPEPPTWWNCGCGAVNGINLAQCGRCTRSRSESEMPQQPAPAVSAVRQQEKTE